MCLFGRPRFPIFISRCVPLSSLTAVIYLFPFPISHGVRKTSRCWSWNMTSRLTRSVTSRPIRPARQRRRFLTFLFCTDAFALACSAPSEDSEVVDYFETQPDICTEVVSGSTGSKSGVQSNPERMKSRHLPNSEKHDILWPFPIRTHPGL